MTDVFLKLTGNDAQVIAALRTLGIDKEMLRHHEEGPPTIESVYNHDVAVNFIPNLMTKRATDTAPAEFDGPHLMVRFVSKRMNDMAAEKIIEHRPNLPDDTPVPDLPRTLPAGLEVVLSSETIGWA